MESDDLANMRLALYEDVWSQPMTAVASKYGLSDNGIRKRCRSLNIPIPPFGYWPKLKAGKVTATRPPLPAYSPTEIDYIHKSDVDITPPVKKKTSILELKDYDSIPIDQLSAMHDLDLLTVDSRQAFLDWCYSVVVAGRIREFDELITKHKYEIEYRESRDKEYPFREGHLDIHYIEGRIKNRNNESTLPISVSSTQRNRAYRIVDTLFSALRILKARITVDRHANGEDNINIMLLDSSVSFTMSECKTKRRHMSSSVDPNDLRPLYDEVYDGRMQLSWTIDKSWSYFDKDSKQKSQVLSYIDSLELPLENQVSTMLVEVYKACCNNKIQVVLEHRKYEILREQEHKDFLAEEEAKARKAKEQKKLSQQSSLISNIPKHANNWFTYRQLTAYVNDLEIYVSSYNNPEHRELLKQYINFVKANAERCNPINSIIDEMKTINTED